MRPMNATEKILARAAGQNEVVPGEIVQARVDMTLTHEKLGPVFFPDFRSLNVPIWDLDKVVMFVDHNVPSGTINDANLCLETRQFARDYGVKHFYWAEGVCHQVMPEKGHVLPGELLVGTDSHTTTHGAFGALAIPIGSTEMAWVYAKGSLWLRVPQTLRFQIDGKLADMVMAKDVFLYVCHEAGIDGAVYKAMEFSGTTIEEMSVDGRMVLCNMAVEMGAKNAILNPDDKVFSYVQSRTDKTYTPVYSDPDAQYEHTFHLDGSKMVPVVACPHIQDNVKLVTEVKDVAITRAFIGTCTGGRMEDLRAAARILEGRKVARDVMLQIVPASQEVYRDALREGLLEVFLGAGAIIHNSNCGPCGGSQMGVLGRNEVCIGANNRNIRGRMGDLSAQIYLGSPITVAASAITGKITDPREFI